MRKFTKGNCPDFLRDNWEKWGARYKANREQNPGFTFQWPTHQKMKINQKIESELKPYTQSHCSFCDNFPIRGNEDSLDHFKPKSIEAHYELVCQWENLYYSCTNCQSTRKEQYSNLLLRPDALTYDFSSYFVYNYTTHEIDIKEGASKAIQQKAKYTRDKFGLNDIGNVKARELWYEKYFYAIALNLEPDIDTYPFRFMFD